MQLELTGWFEFEDHHGNLAYLKRLNLGFG